MNLEQLHFLKLSEECHEVGQECSKIMQFGLDEVYAPIGISNRERLKRELQDLYAVVQILNEDFDLGFVPSPEAVEVKRQKIAHYAKYSATIGLVEPSMTECTQVMRVFNIGWLGGCAKCGYRVHSVKTRSSAGGWLYEGEKVTCNNCGHNGVIEVTDNQCEVKWS